MRTTFIVTIAAASCLAQADVDPMHLYRFPGDTDLRADQPLFDFDALPRDPFDDGGGVNRGFGVTPSDTEHIDLQGLNTRGEVLPAPGSVLLLGAGALVAGRRRR